MATRKFPKALGAVPAVIDGATFVSERLGFVYLCVPKTLSRSMLQYLAAVDPDGYRIVDRTAGSENFRGVAEANVATTFTFVRNPYSRAVAFYYDKFVNYLGTPGQQAIFGRYERLRPDMSFSEFVDWLATDEGSDEHADAHFLSQHYFLVDVDGAPAVDYLGKVESVEEDLAELQRLLGLRCEPLPHLNSNATREGVRFDSSQRWLDVLDDRSKRLLASRYDGDFELLGYARLPYNTVPTYSRRGGARRGGNARVTKANGSQLSRGRVVVNRLLAPFGVEVRRTRRKVQRPRGAN